MDTFLSLHQCEECSKNNYIDLNIINELMLISFLTPLPEPTFDQFQQFISDGYICFGFRLPNESPLLPKLFCQNKHKHNLNSDSKMYDIIVVAKSLIKAASMLKSNYVDAEIDNYMAEQIYTLVGISKIFALNA